MTAGRLLSTVSTRYGLRQTRVRRLLQQHYETTASAARAVFSCFRSLPTQQQYDEIIYFFFLPCLSCFFFVFFFSFVLFFFRIFFCLLSCALPETVSLRFAIVSRVQYGGGGEGEGVVMGHEGLGGGRGKYVSGDSK